MGSKKVILKLDFHDDKDKQKAMKAVSKIPRIDSISMDMKDMKLTVIGDIDPITVANRLRKFWNTDIAFVGPAKEPEKKKDGGGGGDPNKKKDDSAGKDNKDGKKKDPEPIPAPYNPYMLPYYPHNSVVTYNPHMYHPQHVNSYYPPPPTMPASYESYVHEENPNWCAIC